MSGSAKYSRTFPLYSWGKVFFLILFLAAGGVMTLLAGGCTEYERRGINARPFNEPSAWEINPYGQDAFRN